LKIGVQSRLAVDNKLAEELYCASCGEQYGLTQRDFTAILEQIVARQTDLGSREQVSAFLRGLHLEELALARGCAAGHQSAWDFFLTRYRETLYMAARSIAREEGAARDLADSLYADLYGMRMRDGERMSKLASYNGRGSLAGWLRTVLAQQHIDEYRKVKRLVSLEEESEKGVQFASAPKTNGLNVAVQQDQGKLELATDEALGQLSSEERFLLASYFLDGQTLAQIARVLKVHESTISRKLDKLAGTLRKRIRDILVRDGLSRPRAEELLETDVRDLGVNVRQKVAAPGDGNPQEAAQGIARPTFSIKDKIAPDALKLNRPGTAGKDL
jgi:RNA polymerase sigma-70 factor (ECF subfamily)